MQTFCFIHQKLKIFQIFDKLTDNPKYTDIWIHIFNVLQIFSMQEKNNMKKYKKITICSKKF